MRERFANYLSIVALSLMSGLLFGACADERRPVIAVPVVPSLPAGADFQSQSPVGQEWRQQVSWGSPKEYYRQGFELYQDAIGACLLAKGFSFTRSPWYDDDRVAVVINPLNEQAAATYGYHLPPYGAEDSSKIQIESGPEFDSALSGVGGCGEQGFSFAYGALAEQQSATFDYIVQSVTNAVPLFDSTVDGARLVQTWSRCMSKVGYEFVNPLEPDNKFDSAAVVSEEELRTRKADLDCDRETGLTKSRSAFEQTLFDRWLDENSETVEEYENQLAAAERQVVERSTALREDGAAALAHVLGSAG